MLKLKVLLSQKKSLLTATNFVGTIQEHQNITICCPEEIGYKNGWLAKEKLKEQALLMKKNTYGEHLMRIYMEDEDENNRD